MKKPVILLGSARSEGNTRTLCNLIAENLDAPIIDLKAQNIGHFDYEFQNQQDDFLHLIQTIIKSYDCIIFATPVYWYTMSGQMKVFFDRLSDLLLIHKELGRLLRGKQIAVASCGSDGELKDGFYMPFIESAAYLGMIYSGNVHGWVKDNDMTQEVKSRLIQFCQSLKA